MPKITRRDTLKVLGAAGAFLVAQPHLSKISSFAEAAPSSSGTSLNAPLVVLVKDGQLIGFKGEKEFAVKDQPLAATLQRRFNL